MFFVATEKSLSRQTSQGLLSLQSFPCRDRVYTAPCRDRVSCVATGHGAGRAEVRSTARSVSTTVRSECALCMR